VKNINDRSISLWFAILLFAWLPCASIAHADMIGDDAGKDISSPEFPFGDLPASELGGWFFNPNSPPPFPAQPDLSQPWTSAENIALMNYWLGLVSQLELEAQLQNDPALLAQLYGLGMLSDPGAPQLSQLGTVNSQQNPSEVPEPLTMGLLVVGLLLVGSYAGARMRRMQPAPAKSLEAKSRRVR
jgi:hypothetical protein